VASIAGTAPSSGSAFSITATSSALSSPTM
jgi:hypothetical protein